MAGMEEGQQTWQLLAVEGQLMTEINDFTCICQVGKQNGVWAQRRMLPTHRHADTQTHEAMLCTAALTMRGRALNVCAPLSNWGGDKVPAALQNGWNAHGLAISLHHNCKGHGVLVDVD